MLRAGQSSEKAALIYQHSDEDGQREVATGLDDLVRAERAKTTPTTVLSNSRSQLGKRRRLESRIASDLGIWVPVGPGSTGSRSC